MYAPLADMQRPYYTLLRQAFALLAPNVLSRWEVFVGKSFAEQKWEQVQVAAATAWANLDISVEMIENNREELTDEQYAEIMAKVDEQQKYIQDTLLEAKVDYEKHLEGLNKNGGKDDVQTTGADAS